MTLMGKDTVALVQNMLRKISFKGFVSLLSEAQLLFHLVRGGHQWLDFSRTFSSWMIAFMMIQGLLQPQQVWPSLKKLLSFSIEGVVKEYSMS